MRCWRGYLSGTRCRRFTLADASAYSIDAVDQWCLRTLLGIKWHQFVCNEEVRRITKQPNLTAIIQSQRLSMFRHLARMDDDADTKMIITAPHQTTGTDHHGIPVSHSWTPSSEIWEPTTSHWIKQSTWPRTVVCGGWCLRMALHTASGACQKRRSPQSKLEGGCSNCTQLTLLPNGWRHMLVNALDINNSHPWAKLQNSTKSSYHVIQHENLLLHKHHIPPNTSCELCLMTHLSTCLKSWLQYCINHLLHSLTYVASVALVHCQMVQRIFVVLSIPQLDVVVAADHDSPGPLPGKQSKQNAEIYSTIMYNTINLPSSPPLSILSTVFQLNLG